MPSFLMLTNCQVTVVADVRASVYYKTHYLAFSVSSISKTAPLSRLPSHASGR